jgi:hypothetical protein
MMHFLLSGVLDNGLLTEQHPALSETRRERVVLQGRGDGLDGHGAGGSREHDPAYRTPGVDDPCRRVGLRLISVASAMRGNFDMEARRRPLGWGDALPERGHR